MLIQTTITTQIRNAKIYGKDYLSDLLEIESNGGDVKEQKIRLIILHRYIEALQRYYDAHWDDDGVAIDPVVDDCLDEAYFDKLMIKIKTITENKTYAADDWILSAGTWADLNHYWRDGSSWIDYP